VCSINYITLPSCGLGHANLQIDNRRQDNLRTCHFANTRFMDTQILGRVDDYRRCISRTSRQTVWNHRWSTCLFAQAEIVKVRTNL